MLVNIYRGSKNNINFVQRLVSSLATVRVVRKLRKEPGHRIDTQPEVRLRVGAFDVCVLVFSAAAIFLASVHGTEMLTFN